MNRLMFFVLFMVLLLITAGLLFFDQVLSIFQGMTVLQSMQMIVQFILHVAVATIAAYALYQVNELILPWWRAAKYRWMRFQKKQIKMRNQWFDKALEKRSAPKVNKSMSMPKGMRDQALYWMIDQLARKNSHSSSTQIVARDEQPRTRLDV